MSNETKRDVFEQLLNAYQNLISEDNEIHDENYHVNITTPLNIVYDNALPDNLPVIPFRVAEVIKTNQADTELTIVLMRAKTGHQPDEYWINNHQNTFARAWVLGVWRVEETAEIVKFEAEEL